MNRWIHSAEAVFAMSNVRGRYIKVENDIPFSFYYSPRNSSHGPRVKVIFNPDRMKQNLAGNLMLCDDWSFTPGRNDTHVSSKQISEMKDFFRKYLILFLLVWDGHSDEPDPEDYFRKDMDLHELITRIDFYDDHAEDLDKVESIEELEQFCRENSLVNFYRN